MSRITLIFMIFLLTGMIKPAAVYPQQGIRELTLGQAIEIGQKNSPDALNSKQVFRASYWDYRSFRAQYLPSLILDANPFPSYYNNYKFNSSSLESRPEKNITNLVDLSLNQMIGFTGGILSLTSSLSRFDNLYSDSVSSKYTQYTSNPINISYTQPLFKFNSYRWDRRIRPLQYEVAKKKYLEDLELINVKITDYFFNLLQAQIDKKIALTNQSNYDTLFRIAKGRYQLGKIAENELLMLELNLLKAQASVETADLELDNAQFYFKSFLRIKDTIPIELKPPKEITYFIVNPVTAIKEAENNSSASMDFTRQRLEAARDVNRAKMDGRFDVDISANVGLGGSTFGALPEAYRNLSASQQVSVGVKVPILDWGVARGRIKMAESQQEIVLNNIEQAIIDYDRNIYLQVMRFNMQRNQIRIAAKADTVAKKTYDVTKGRYLIGKITSILELNNAQIETDSYQKAYLSALQTYWKSYFELRKLTLFDFQMNRPLNFNFEDVKP